MSKVKVGTILIVEWPMMARILVIPAIYPKSKTD